MGDWRVDLLTELRKRCLLTPYAIPEVHLGLGGEVAFIVPFDPEESAPPDGDRNWCALC
jgi:hypothetical protein